MLLNIALVKGDHSLAVVSKKITSGGAVPVKKTAITVPLKTLAQVNREMEMHIQQNAIASQQNSQQNINIHQQKDGLDSINGALDALIKLNGLGTLFR
jgi:hypothetical protein